MLVQFWYNWCGWCYLKLQKKSRGLQNKKSTTVMIYVIETIG